MGKDVIVACDFDSAEKTFEFLDKFTEKKPFIKIGMELFFSETPEIVRDIKKRGHKIFLDLKLHDIPNTVKKAMAALSKLDIDMCNVAFGGNPRHDEGGSRRPDERRRHQADTDSGDTAHLHRSDGHGKGPADKRRHERRGNALRQDGGAGRAGRSSVLAYGSGKST